jgi:hypothetical protein
MCAVSSQRTKSVYELLFTTRRCLAMLAISLFPSEIVWLTGCRREPALQLRTDADPLVHRLKLPSRIGGVRWLAVSPNKDTGWIPPKIESYNDDERHLFSFSLLPSRKRCRQMTG